MGWKWAEHGSGRSENRLGMGCVCIKLSIELVIGLVMDLGMRRLVWSDGHGAESENRA